MSDISDRIKELRKTLGLSQEKFGKLAGVSKAAVSQWELGITKPERDALLALRKNKQINTLWITTGDGDIFDKSPGGELARVFRDTYNQKQLDQLMALIDIECLSHALEALDYLEKTYTKMDNTRKRAEILLELYKINKENMDAGEQPIAPSNVVRLAKAFG